MHESGSFRSLGAGVHCAGREGGKISPEADPRQPPLRILRSFAHDACGQKVSGDDLFTSFHHVEGADAFLEKLTLRNWCAPSRSSQSRQPCSCGLLRETCDASQLPCGCGKSTSCPCSAISTLQRGHWAHLLRSRRQSLACPSFWKMFASFGATVDLSDKRA